MPTLSSNGGAWAVVACAAMASFYVAILYVPPLLFGRPRSFKHLMLQRFGCATISSIAAPAFCLFLLSKSKQASFDFIDLLGVLGVRIDHLLQAVLFPLLLTGTFYLGSIAVDVLTSFEQRAQWPICSYKSIFRIACLLKMDVLAWRNYVMAPLSEEIVFRACMIPLLLCGGFSIRTIIFLSPFFFGLAHVHHFWEMVNSRQFTKQRAAIIVVAQLGYTVIFGWYAAFWFLRTGHLVAPLAAHILCNYMGFPNVVGAMQIKVAPLTIIGFISFLCLLFPITTPSLYNGNIDSCNCWLGICKWKKLTT